MEGGIALVVDRQVIGRASVFRSLGALAFSYPVREAIRMRSALVREYAEDEPGARTIVFEGPSQGEGFQIFVVPYDKSEITRERFLTDDPSGVMNEPGETVVDGTPAKTFFGYNDHMGNTREVWFIHGGFLYEVTTYKPLSAWLPEILQTWKFI